MAGSQNLLFWGGICFIYFLKIQTSSQEDKFLLAVGVSPAEARTTPSSNPRNWVHSIGSGSHFRLRNGRTRNHRMAHPKPTLKPLAPKWLLQRPVVFYPGPPELNNSTSHLPSINLLFKHPPEGWVDKMGPSPTPQGLHPLKAIWKTMPRGCYDTVFLLQLQQSDTNISCPLWGLRRQKNVTFIPPRRRRPRHRHRSPLWAELSNSETLASPAPSHEEGEPNHSLSFLQLQLTTTTTTQPSRTDFLQSQPALLQIVTGTPETTIPSYPESGKSSSPSEKQKVDYISFGGWRLQRQPRHYFSFQEEPADRQCFDCNVIASVANQASLAPTVDAKIQDITTSHSLISGIPPQQISHSTRRNFGPNELTSWALLTTSPWLTPESSSSQVKRINLQDSHRGFASRLQRFISSPRRGIFNQGQHGPYRCKPKRPLPETLPPLALRSLRSFRHKRGSQSLHEKHHSLRKKFILW